MSPLRAYWWWIWKQVLSTTMKKTTTSLLWPTKENRAKWLQHEHWWENLWLWTKWERTLSRDYCNSIWHGSFYIDLKTLVWTNQTQKKQTRQQRVTVYLCNHWNHTVWDKDAFLCSSNKQYKGCISTLQHWTLKYIWVFDQKCLCTFDSQMFYKSMKTFFVNLPLLTWKLETKIQWVSRTQISMNTTCPEQGILPWLWFMMQVFSPSLLLSWSVTPSAPEDWSTAQTYGIYDAWWERKEPIRWPKHAYSQWLRVNSLLMLTHSTFSIHRMDSRPRNESQKRPHLHAWWMREWQMA